MSHHISETGAKFFGKENPFEIQELESRSLSASDEHLAQAARYIEDIFGESHAWCGGWAMRLRGSERQTIDLDVVIQAPSTVKIWEKLVQYHRITLFYHKHVLEEGGDQFKIFVDANDGQIVCVDVILAGRLHTPTLRSEGVVDVVSPAFIGAGGNKRVMSLRWQVRQKLKAIDSRRKESDYTDLLWLINSYESEIGRWIQDEDKPMREKFFQWVYDNEMDDDRVAVMRQYLGL